MNLLQCVSVPLAMAQMVGREAAQASLTTEASAGSWNIFVIPASCLNLVLVRGVAPPAGHAKKAILLQT